MGYNYNYPQESLENTINTMGTLNCPLARKIDPISIPVPSTFIICICILSSGHHELPKMETFIEVGGRGVSMYMLCILII